MFGASKCNSFFLFFFGNFRIAVAFNSTETIHFGLSRAIAARGKNTHLPHCNEIKTLKLAAFAVATAAAAVCGRADGAKPEQSSALQSPKLDDAPQGPFFLVDETPANTVKILEALTGKIAIVAPNLPNVKINFSTEGKLSRSEAIVAFKSLLTANGVAITPLGEKFFKASHSGSFGNAGSRAHFRLGKKYRAYAGDFLETLRA